MLHALISSTIILLKPYLLTSYFNVNGGNIEKYGERLVFVSEAVLNQILSGLKTIRQDIQTTNKKMDAKFEQIHVTFGQIDQKFGKIDRKFDQIDQTFE